METWSAAVLVLATAGRSADYGLLETWSAAVLVRAAVGLTNV